jgi:hypothetical protein
MKRNAKALAIIGIVIAACSPVILHAQGGAPLQVDVRVRAKGNGMGAFFQRQIENGTATVSGRVQNLPGNETALVTLRFDYHTDADIALDEIIDRIVISIEDLSGNQFSTVTMDPDTIHLNPNRVPLYYSVTLHTPDRPRIRSGYFVHVQVYGNYE